MNGPDPQIPISFPEARETRSPLRLAETMVEKVRERQEREAIAAGLPSCPEQSQGIPNSVLRSALFGVASHIYHVKETMIASVEGVDIFITRGKRLIQPHLDVWEECLELGRTQGTGRRIEFTAYSFLKAIGRSTGSSDMKWLADALYDLASTLVRITDGSRSYFGTLIQGGARDEASGRYVIEINPKLAVLFMEGRWTAVVCEERVMLRRHPLAQWLHGFYSTHSSPYRYKVETIKALCGSEVTELWKFRQILKRALLQLSDATGWECQIDDTDKVVISRKGARVMTG